MKKTAFLFLMLFVFIISTITAQSNANFSYKPEKPKAGAEIMVSYNPVGTALDKATDLSMLVYQYGINLNSSDEYELQKDGNRWLGKFSVADTAKGVILQFTSGEEKDNNGKRGFVINLYDDKGNFLPGSRAGLAVAYSSWGDLAGIEADKQLAYKLFQNDFKQNPSLEKDYLNSYLTLISQIYRDKGNDMILEKLNNFSDPSQLDETQLTTITNWYTRLKDADKAEPFKKQILAKFPTGSFFQSQKYNEFRILKDIDAKLKFVASFNQSFAETNLGQYLNGNIINEYVKTGQFDKAKDYLEKTFTYAKATNYNSLAWSMYEKNGDLIVALGLAQKAVEMARKDLADKNGKRQNYQTQSEFLKDKKDALATVLDTYGAIQIKLGKNLEAQKSLNEAVKLSEGKSNETNERYASILIMNGIFGQAKTELEKFISNGVSTPAMRDLLKQTYMKETGSENGFDKYLAKYEEKASQKKITGLKKEMINEPAPQFSLLDLDGKQVSLVDFKGKVVIIDFWATWCSPCLASFPGMKKAVEKYAANQNIKFLFVDSWERVENKKQNAIDFLKKNNYPFHILQDDQNEVISNFNVSGIPTKFFIDKKGNIRLKSIGFDGSTDDLAKEIDLIISLLQ